MNGLKRFLLRLSFLFMKVVYFFLKLLPTQDKYLFITKVSNTPPVDFTVLSDALKKAHPDYRQVMLCKRMDNKIAYVGHFFVQMYHLATSRVVFLDRSCLVIHILNHKPELKVIQLWHALGSMKSFGFAILDTPEGQSTAMAKLCCMHRGYTYILISSMSFLEDYRLGFHTDGSNVLEIPLPHVDLLTSEKYVSQKKNILEKQYPQLSTKINVLYCPTFRKDEGPEDLEAIEALIECFDFSKYNLIYQPHPVSNLTLKDSRILVLPYSTLDLLCVADVLVSDYSSVIYEAGLRHLPIYLYGYDWAIYHGKRSHNIDIPKEVPVLFSSDPHAVVSAIEHRDFDDEAFNQFIENNIALPAEGTCCEALIRVLDRD